MTNHRYTISTEYATFRVVGTEDDVIDSIAEHVETLDIEFDGFDVIDGTDIYVIVGVDYVYLGTVTRHDVAA